MFPRALQVDIAIPEVFVAGLLGSMLVFLFSAFAITAVGRTAQAVVSEVSGAGHDLHLRGRTAGTASAAFVARAR